MAGTKRICPVLSETSMRKVPGSDRPVVGFRVVVCDEDGFVYLTESSTSDRPVGQCKWFDKESNSCQVSISRMVGRLKKNVEE